MVDRSYWATTAAPCTTQREISNPRGIAYAESHETTRHDTRRLVGAAVPLFLILSVSALAADEGKVVPLSAEDQKALALLGEGVVGKALPAHPIEDVGKFLDLQAGPHTFKIVAGNDQGKTQVETYTSLGAKDGSQQWKRTIGDQYDEFLTLSAGSTGKTAETEKPHGYRAAFDPPMHEHVGIAPGESVNIESKMRVSTEKDPSKIKYTGKMNSTITYVGAYQVKVPAGSFEAILVKVDVGPADVEDTQYTFFAKGVGKVAEIEALRVSAALIYHSHSKTAKVLVTHPASRK